MDVQGRALRNGTIQARTVTNKVTGAKITTRGHPAVVRSRIQAILSLIAIVIVVIVIIGRWEDPAPSWKCRCRSAAFRQVLSPDHRRTAG